MRRADSDMKSSPNNGVIRLLRDHAGEWLTAASIAETLELEYSRLELAITELVKEGYRIDVLAGRGYRFTGCADRPIAREVQRELGTAIIGRRIICLQQTPSTNDEAWQEVDRDALEGTVILAEEQTAGRGRMGRSWYSPPNVGLFASVILRPELEVRHSHVLTAMTAVAVAQMIRENLQASARIRWPNDIFIHGCKVAGILVEGRLLAQGAAFVLGIGVNVNQQLEDFPPELRGIAASLSMAAGHCLKRVQVIRWLLQSLDRWYRDLGSGDVGRIANTWRQLSSTLGHRVLLVENGREFRGTVLDLFLAEGLIVRLDEGLTRVFQPEKVTLRHLPETR